MKKKKFKKKKFVWGFLEFSDPYKVIHQIFNHGDIKFYRDFIGDILLFSSLEEKYRKIDPANVMDTLEGINCLLEACYAISKEKKSSHLEVRKSDLVNFKFYSSSETSFQQWFSFPRSLSLEEAIDPYKTFNQIFVQYKPIQLYRDFKYLTENACGSYCDAHELNPLEIYVQLTKLIEAAHLICVRELNHILNWR